MARLIFCILWTAFASLLAWLALQDAKGGSFGFPAAFAVLFPALGLFGIVSSFRQLRRRRSLRMVPEGDVTIYVWIDLNGRECRSRDDPRPGWEDADGDGDGDGGD